MPKRANTHWYVWCEANAKPIEWLKDKIQEGFDVHHIDGDKLNEDPSNLVLIWCGDHMMLHGMGRICRVSRVRAKNGTYISNKEIVNGAVHEFPGEER